MKIHALILQQFLEPLSLNEFILLPKSSIRQCAQWKEKMGFISLGQRGWGYLAPRAVRNNNRSCSGLTQPLTPCFCSVFLAGQGTVWSQGSQEEAPAWQGDSQRSCSVYTMLQHKGEQEWEKSALPYLHLWQIDDTCVGNLSTTPYN